MIPIILADGVTKVWLSIEDVEDALKYSWHIHMGYPRSTVDGKKVYLHRWIADRMGLALDELIDHGDRNPLNATRENLRYANHQLNCFNRGMMSNNTSGYKGVSWDRDRNGWRVSIMLNNKARFLGYYDDPISAAVAYDLAAIKLFGEDFAATNLKLGYLKGEDYIGVKPRRSGERRKLSSVGYRGVTLKRKVYHAQISVNGSPVDLGVYPDPISAAVAYDLAAVEYFGDSFRGTNLKLGLISKEDYKKAQPRRVSDRERASGKVGFKGVTLDRKGGYPARVKVEGKQIHLGTYKTPIEAARSYDTYVIENGLNRVTNASLGLL